MSCSSAAYSSSSASPSVSLCSRRVWWNSDSASRATCVPWSSRKWQRRASSITLRRRRSGNSSTSRMPGPVRGHVVGDDPLAQRRLAERGLLGAGQLQRGPKDDRAGVDRVGAPRVQPGHPAARRDRGAAQLLLQRRQIGQRDRRLVAAVLGAQQAGQRRRRPRRERDVVEAHGPHARDHRLQHGPHAVSQVRPLARGRRIGAGEALGQADDAQLQRRRVVELLRVGEDDLQRAAAEIEQRHPPLAQVQRTARPQVDEPRLLVAADDADVDARLVAGGAHELTAVLRLANGAGRDRHQRVDLVPIGDAPQRLQRVQAAPEHLGRDDALVQASSRPGGPSPWRDRGR